MLGRRDGARIRRRNRRKDWVEDCSCGSGRLVAILWARRRSRSEATTQLSICSTSAALRWMMQSRGGDGALTSALPMMDGPSSLAPAGPRHRHSQDHHVHRPLRHVTARHIASHCGSLRPWWRSLGIRLPLPTPSYVHPYIVFLSVTWRGFGSTSSRALVTKALSLWRWFHTGSRGLHAPRAPIGWSVMGPERKDGHSHEDHCSAGGGGGWVRWWVAVWTESIPRVIVERPFLPCSKCCLYGFLALYNLSTFRLLFHFKLLFLFLILF